MSAVGDLQIPRLAIARGTALIAKLERRHLLVLALSVAVGFGVRMYKLDAAGLAEDETNKIFATRSYEQGDFTVNAEHPMLLKMLCYGSLHVARVWDQLVGSESQLSISEETALRLPNALFGGLTVVPLFLLAAALLGTRIAMISAVFWTFGLNSVWFNRIAKEDTLLLFFVLTGFYLYNRAKEQPAWDIRAQERLYALAGAAFGLMLCSKYFPHYFGLNALFYHLVGYDRRNNRPLSRPMLARLLAGLVFAFCLFNPAIFAPQTWRYLWQYVNEDFITHHGYLVMDKLFVNDMGQTPQGNAWYLYYLYFGVKLSLPILMAFIVGLVEVFRHRGGPEVARGYVFLRMMHVFWLFPMALLGSKFLRYTLPLMPALYMTAAIGVVKINELIAARGSKGAREWKPLRHLATAVVFAVFVVVPALVTIRNMPFPSLYVNEFGYGRAGYFFPHDEFYDIGARESIRYVAENAPQGSTLASEIPGVVEYYLERFNRPDIHSEVMSHPKFDLSEAHPDYVLLQRGRFYLENRESFTLIENTCSQVQASRVFGAIAAELYKTDGRFARVETRPANDASAFQPADERRPDGL